MDSVQLSPNGCFEFFCGRSVSGVWLLAAAEVVHPTGSWGMSLYLCTEQMVPFAVFAILFGVCF